MERPDTGEAAEAGATEDVSQHQTEGFPAVQVFVRVRPLLGNEAAGGIASMDVQPGRRGTVTVTPKETSNLPDLPDFAGAGGSSSSSSRAGPRRYGFDAVFAPEHSQQNVWEEGRFTELIKQVASGFNATVFAYGQTGSGKTYTMEGYDYETSMGKSPSGPFGHARPSAKIMSTDKARLGIIPRAVDEFFTTLDASGVSEGETIGVKVSFMQIYKERIFDLLNPVSVAMAAEAAKGEESSFGGGLKLRWDVSREKFIVENLFEFECTSVEDVMHHYAHGVQNKFMASTAMNASSSRAHTIFVLTLVRRTPLWTSADDPSSTVGRAYKEVSSNLVLVDLAGSERSSTSTASHGSDDRFKEAVKINQSLFVLRRVVLALSQRSHAQDDSTHIPYRDSKLTSLLQHTLGGNAFMIMLACVCPSDKYADENLSTLQYASQAARIKNEPVLNLDPKDRLILQLQHQLAAAHSYILDNLGVETLPPELQAVPTPMRSRHARIGSRLKGGSQQSLAPEHTMSRARSKEFSSSMQKAGGATSMSASFTSQPPAAAAPPPIAATPPRIPMMPQQAAASLSRTAFANQGSQERLRTPPCIQQERQVNSLSTSTSSGSLPPIRHGKAGSDVQSRGTRKPRTHPPAAGGRQLRSSASTGALPSRREKSPARPASDPEAMGPAMRLLARARAAEAANSFPMQGGMGIDPMPASMMGIEPMPASMAAWADCVEADELSIAKASLEAQLRDAETMAKDLQARLGLHEVPWHADSAGLELSQEPTTDSQTPEGEMTSSKTVFQGSVSLRCTHAEVDTLEHDLTEEADGREL